MDIRKEYDRWLANAVADADVIAELKAMGDTKVEDAFYRDLAFGTGGLRGIIGAGTNRMNVYTVAKASQGLADYLKKNFETPFVAICGRKRSAGVRCREITSLEVASIAFVWSAATPLPDFRMNSGQKPGPTLSTIWRKRHEKRC